MREYKLLSPNEVKWYADIQAARKKQAAMYRDMRKRDPRIARLVRRRLKEVETVVYNVFYEELWNKGVSFGSLLGEEE